MPDISLLLPLSVVLGVTVDCLLGAGTDEKKDKEALDREIDRLNEENNFWAYEDNSLLKIYNEAKKFLHKYPLNYEVRLEGADALQYYLYTGGKNGRFVIPREEYDALWEAGVKDLRSILRHDNDPTRQIESMIQLIDFYKLKEMWDEAEEAASHLPNTKGAELKLRAQRYLAMEKKDYPRADELSQTIASKEADSFLSSMWARARNVSVFGQVRKEEAIRAWKDMKRIAAECLKIFGDVDFEQYKLFAWYMTDAIEMMSNDYLALSDVDSALSCAEEQTELYEKLLAEFDRRCPGEEAKRKELLEFIKGAPRFCYSWVFDTDDNILTREERFKACKARIDALE